MHRGTKAAHLIEQYTFSRLFQGLQLWKLPISQELIPCSYDKRENRLTVPFKSSKINACFYAIMLLIQPYDTKKRFNQDCRTYDEMRSRRPFNEHTESFLHSIFYMCHMTLEQKFTIKKSHNAHKSVQRTFTGQTLKLILKNPPTLKSRSNQTVKRTTTTTTHTFFIANCYLWCGLVSILILSVVLESQCSIISDTIQFDLDASVARASFDELRSDNVWSAVGRLSFKYLSI